MNGEITKIDQWKESRNEDTNYARIGIKLESGTYVMTDICSNYRNYRNWADILVAGVGTKVDGLKYMVYKDGQIDLGKINADSPVKIIA